MTSNYSSHFREVQATRGRSGNDKGNCGDAEKENIPLCRTDGLFLPSVPMSERLKVLSETGHSGIICLDARNILLFISNVGIVGQKDKRENALLINRTFLVTMAGVL